MTTASAYRKENAADLTDFQEFLAERRLAREHQVPYFVRWVQRFP